MSSLAGKWFGPRTMRFIQSINAELAGDVIQTLVRVFKLAAGETKLNIYGEADETTGKSFYSPIEITCFIKKDDITTDHEKFGPDRKQTLDFAFREESLKLANLYPELGDAIEYNQRYYVIDNVVQEQFMGGIPEKSLSIICHSYYERLSALNIVER
jgi:hypothetical protein